MLRIRVAKEQVVMAISVVGLLKDFYDFLKPRIEGFINIISASKDKL